MTLNAYYLKEFTLKGGTLYYIILQHRDECL